MKIVPVEKRRLEAVANEALDHRLWEEAEADLPWLRQQVCPLLARLFCASFATHRPLSRRGLVA